VYRWKQTGPANHVLAHADGSRHSIDRWSDTWVLSFLPTGHPAGGRISVPWLTDKKTLNTAMQSCEAHAQTVTAQTRSTPR
jgi:coproporphyrinogen III oxidase-like Fe-S oxidoreductase